MNIEDYKLQRGTMDVLSKGNLSPFRELLEPLFLWSFVWIVKPVSKGVMVIGLARSGRGNRNG